MALLSQGDTEPGRVGCPACGTLLRAADIHSAAALAATSKAALPPHLRAAVLDIQRGGEGGGAEVSNGQPSSKIRRLMEVRKPPPASALMRSAAWIAGARQTRLQRPTRVLVRAASCCALCDCGLQPV